MTFGGGGNLSYGQRKDQSDTSEFIYRFRGTAIESCPPFNIFMNLTWLISYGESVNPDYVEPRLSQKRKREEDEVEESAAKKAKLLEEQRMLKMFAEALKAKEREAEELKQQLSSVAANMDAELLKKKEEIERKEREKMEAIERERQLRLKSETEAKANQEALVAQLKAKEELMKEQTNLLEEKYKTQQYTFDQELQTLRRSLEEKELAAAQAEADRKMMKELQQKYKQASEQLEKTSAEYVERSEFEEELTCSICQELLLDAQTLECAHSFCASCLAEWRKHKSDCPFCRKKIDKAPVRALNIDSIVSKLISKLPEDDRLEWNRRLTVREQKQQVDKLKEMIAMAKSRGLRFLDVRAAWRDVERQTFKEGVSRYQGEAKKMYCETIGLTPAWVNQAAPKMLLQACTNIGVSTQGSLRDNLLNYIHSTGPFAPNNNNGAAAASSSQGSPALQQPPPDGPPRRNVIDLT